MHDGDLLRFGGEVMKNVAGFDVSRLLCGSLGMLGIITEVSLKVLPLPRVEATLQLELPRGGSRADLQPLGRGAAAAFRGRLERGHGPGAPVGRRPCGTGGARAHRRRTPRGGERAGLVAGVA